jgi:capsular exopolysaccharide synthesis family protein
MIQSNRSDQPTPDQGRTSALTVVIRRWWVVVLTAAFAVAVAVAGLSIVTPTYKATATLEAPIAAGPQSSLDPTFIDRLLNTYTQLAVQPRFKANVARALGLAHSPPLSVAVDTNTELLQLSASDPSAAVATRAANIAANELVAETASLAQNSSQAGESALSSQLDALTADITALRVRLAHVPATSANTTKRLGLEQQITGKQTDYQALVQQRAQQQAADAVNGQRLAIVQLAAQPSSPASPRWPPVLALALALGLLGGVAAAFTLERFLPRLYTVQAIEDAAEAALVAAIPDVSGHVEGNPLFNGGSPAQEAFGMLAVQVLAEAARRDLRTIVVTSPQKGDGKSAVASNLAAELARSGHQVVLVDADMRSPSVHTIFDIPRDTGLSDLLHAQALPGVDEFIAVSKETPNLELIPAGRQPQSAARLLASDRLTYVNDSLAGNHDFVVFDAPPLVVSDPLSIARVSDLVLLVVGGSGVPDRDIQAATRRLRSVGAQHILVVANRWHSRDSAYSYEYGRS